MIAVWIRLGTTTNANKVEIRGAVLAVFIFRLDIAAVVSPTKEKEKNVTNFKITCVCHVSLNLTMTNNEK